MNKTISITAGVILISSALVTSKSYANNSPDNLTQIESSEKDSRGWYVGGLTGSTSVQIKVDNERANKEQGQYSGVYGGFNFNQWFGLEARFYRAFNLENSNIGSNYDISGLSITPKFNFPINEKLSFFATLGTNIMVYEEDRLNDDYYYDTQWRGVGQSFGLGLEYTFNRKINIRFNYDQMKTTVENDDNFWFFDFEDDLDITNKNLTIAVHYQF